MPIRLHRLQVLSALFVLVLMTLIAVTPLWAQKDAGAIVGLVRDSSGAVVTGAKVTVTDVERGIQLTFVTNEAGEYVASPLRIGRYTVTVEKQGFKKEVAGPVQVNIQDRVGVDMKLQAGAATEVITVTGERAQLETETSDLGQVVDAKRINSLPLNGRNYAQLALLGTGVALSEPGSRVETTFGFSANGARSLQNNFLLDGIDNNANLGDVLNGAAYVVQPAVDAISEFKVETNAYSAEFGRGNGAIMNAVIKSGTNQLHGDVWEFLRNEKVDAINPFDQFGQQPYKQNQFGFTLGGPIVKNKMFIFGDYEGLRVSQGKPQLSAVPTQDEIGGDFSAFLDTTKPAYAVDMNGNPTTQVALDCNGNPTYQGEIFNSQLAGYNANNPNGYCGVPIGGYLPSTVTPANKFNGTNGTIDPLGAELAGLFPTSNTTEGGGNNFLSDPKKTETENKFDIRYDYTISAKDNFFTRFSYGNDSTFLPSPFSNVLDGGSFQDGYSQNLAEGLAASEVHSFSNNLINEVRFGFNHLTSHRYNLNYNVNVAQQLTPPFPGVPSGPNLGGLPSISFSDGTTGIGSSEYQPALEHQHSYVFNENLSWVRGRHAMKFGTELRFEQFTILEPAAARGYMSFGNDFTDNPASPGSGGEAIATFLLGIPDGGGINGLNNIIYNRQIYAAYALDDFKVTPRLTLNLGLRYEFFSTIKEADNLAATFDFNSLSLIVPSGINTQLTPTLASVLAIQRNGTPGLINPDKNNFAPRIGLSYQLSDKLVLRSGYGVFYGGQENGPFSNPSPGFNPPFSASQAWNPPCTAAVANTNPSFPVNPSLPIDCSLSLANSPGLPLNVLSQGFPANSLSDPNTPSLYSIDPHLVTPYTQQWHLGLQYQLPADTVLEVSYAGSRGLKLYAFFNGNQAVPSAVASDPTAPRRPAHQVTPGDTTGSCTLDAYYNNPSAYDCNGALDTGIATFRSNTQSNYNSLQVRLEKRYSHGLQYEVAYTFAHALDNASSASLGSVNNGDFQDQRYPNQNYGNADFDVRHRFVFSYVYDLPFGRGKMFAKDASGVVNQILGNWQMSGVFSAATGNYYTATDVVSVSNSDCGGYVGYYCSRPAIVGNPNGRPCVAGTLFNTCAFSDNLITPGIIPQGTFGSPSRNIITGPGYTEWDTSLVKQFPISEQKHLEFRAEFFNVLNHVNYLFGNFGAISAEPTPLELNVSSPSSGFGFPLAARDPREIQFALKFYF
ncbi:MAG TPA: TonB-dependent receptor [Terriglobales bacterium]|nr:TonB-dependent receptor [Terriglobales bacterium]